MPEQEVELQTGRMQRVHAWQQHRQIRAAGNSDIGNVVKAQAFAANQPAHNARNLRQVIHESVASDVSKAIFTSAVARTNAHRTRRRH